MQGHVQKRVRSALRKLKKRTKGLGEKRKPTNAMIDRLQNYYSTAIRSKIGNKDKMTKAMHATLSHCASSKDNNYHVLHQRTITTMCIIQMVQIVGANKKIGTHNAYMHLHCWQVAFIICTGG